MKKIFAITTIVAATIAGSANALTIPSGSVLTSSGEVVPIEESENTRRQLEHNGYTVGAGKVIIAVGDDQVVFTQDELTGKSQNEIVEIIKQEIIDSGFASGGIYVEGLGDATAAANEAASEAYQAATEAAVYADNIANGVSEEIAAEASKGFTFEEFCNDSNATGDKSGC